MTIQPKVIGSGAVMPPARHVPGTRRVTAVGDGRETVDGASPSGRDAASEARRKAAAEAIEQMFAYA